MKKVILILITIIAFAFLMVFCNLKEDDNVSCNLKEDDNVSCNLKEDDNVSCNEYENKCIVTSFTIEESNYYRSLEKFTIEGHEYLVFGSKLANPPTVIHSESCPCKTKPINVKLTDR